MKVLAKISNAKINEWIIWSFWFIKFVFTNPFFESMLIYPKEAERSVRKLLR